VNSTRLRRVLHSDMLRPREHLLAMNTAPGQRRGPLTPCHQRRSKPPQGVCLSVALLLALTAFGWSPRCDLGRADVATMDSSTGGILSAALAEPVTPPAEPTGNRSRTGTAGDAHGSANGAAVVGSPLCSTFRPGRRPELGSGKADVSPWRRSVPFRAPPYRV
jgi:hypothetical protein